MFVWHKFFCSNSFVEIFLLQNGIVSAAKDRDLFDFSFLFILNFSINTEKFLLYKLMNTHTDLSARKINWQIL